MKKENYTPRDIEEQKFRPQQGSESVDDELIVDEAETRDQAIYLAKNGLATVEYERNGSEIISVTVKNPVGEIIFYSKDTADIGQFMEIKMPEQ